MTYILFGIEQNLLWNHSVTGTAWESQAIELEFLATTPSKNETPELPLTGKNSLKSHQSGPMAFEVHLDHFRTS
jgi:hypothetical protein